MAYDMAVEFNTDIVKVYSQHHPIENKQDLIRAYDYASQKHAGQKRGSGEAYIKHPLRTARSCAKWRADKDVIMAALLHDVAEDCNTPLSEIEKSFGPNVAAIVDAVTALSDRDFDNHTPTKGQRDILSDAKLQRKMNYKALYVKVADRIDNLRTMSGVKEEKRIPKAEHTREIIVPMCRLAQAHHFADVLEELCFEIEHPTMYANYKKHYRRVLKTNDATCRESLAVLSRVFDPSQKINHPHPELNQLKRYIVNFYSNKRSYISLHRQISRGSRNIVADWSSLLSKYNVALYDLTLVVSDAFLADTNVNPYDMSDLNSLDDSTNRSFEVAGPLFDASARLYDMSGRPYEASVRQAYDIFFEYFDKELSHNGFYLLKYCYTTNRDSGYFLIADRMDNMYRLFVRTEREQQRYLYGNIVDDSDFMISDVNETDPRDTYKEKIKIFLRNGNKLSIDKGATVLDVAFYIHPQTGLHFSYAMLDESKTQLPCHTRLNEGDTITIVTDEDAWPEIAWFKYVNTVRAKHELVKYFQKKLAAGAGTQSS
jgi:hypothetical protein